MRHPLVSRDDRIGPGESGAAAGHAARVPLIHHGPNPHIQAHIAALPPEEHQRLPWRLRPGPSMVSVLERADDFSTATTELWLPVERD
jgi:AraC family transcriptional regulator